MNGYIYTTHIHTHTHTRITEQYSTTKKNEAMSFAATLMDLEINKDKYMVLLVYGI